jgi:superfamily II DNA or RNA helicase
MFQEDEPALKRWLVERIGPDADPRTKSKVLRECRSQLLKLKEKKYPNIILLTQAGSEAVNLQTASAFIFYDNPWSPGDYDQLLGRMIRIGSKHSLVVAIHLICRGTMDDHTMEILRRKSKWIKQVLGEQTKGALEFDDESDIREIFGRLRQDAMLLKTNRSQALKAMKI